LVSWNENFEKIIIIKSHLVSYFNLKFGECTHFFFKKKINFLKICT
jgi:hypothetical protein